jgi:sulfonate transport system ATP-binding protein
MQQLIETLWREHGFTALLVMHDVSETVALADRVVLIEDQRIAFDERVPLPRPRPRADPAFAAFEARVPERLLKPSAPPDSEADDATSPATGRLRWAV